MHVPRNSEKTTVTILFNVLHEIRILNDNIRTVFDQIEYQQYFIKLRIGYNDETLSVKNIDSRVLSKSQDAKRF